MSEEDQSRISSTCQPEFIAAFSVARVEFDDYLPIQSTLLNITKKPED